MLKLLIENPILNILSFFYFLTSNLGLSIILLTILIKVILFPFMVPTFKNMKKQKALKPQLDALKEKYKEDKKKITEEQMKLFKEHGINPTSGCLTQIVTIFVLIGLYQVIQRFVSTTNLSEINADIYFQYLHFKSLDLNFLGQSLSNPDMTYILPVIAGVATFITSMMMLPEISLEEKIVKKTTKDPMEEMAYSMQTQMTIIAPIMTFYFGLTLNAGVSLYIAVSSILTIIQQYILLGNFGGVVPYTKLIKRKLFKK